MGQAPNNATAKLDYRDYLTRVSRDLTERIEHQREVMLKLIEQQESEGKSIEYCPLVDCAPNKALKEGLREAIAVLEETRKSFKSRRLEELRLKLEGLLVEDRD